MAFGNIDHASNISDILVGYGRDCLNGGLGDLLLNAFNDCHPNQNENGRYLQEKCGVLTFLEGTWFRKGRVAMVSIS